MSKDTVKKLKYQAPRLLPLDGVTAAEGSSCTPGSLPAAFCGVGSGATGGSCGDGSHATNAVCNIGNDAANCQANGALAA